MKILIIAVTLLVCFTNTSQSNNLNTSPSINAFYMVGGGSIVMVDDIMMRADTQNPNEHISSITICNSAGATLIQLNGCAASVCENDLSNLAKGTHSVCVVTDTGREITDTITLN